MNDLRTTIMNAIRKSASMNGHSYPPGPHVAGIYADAVIHELGLRRCTSCDGCVNCDWTYREPRSSEKLGLIGDGA